MINIHPPDNLRRLLCQLLVQPPNVADLRVLEAPGRTEAFIELARFHGVAAMLWPALRTLSEADPELCVGVRREWAEAAALQFRVRLEIAALAELLEGTRWLVFKGPALGEGVYPQEWLRAYSDLDLLVPPGEYGHVLKRMLAAGYRAEDWRGRDGDDLVGQLPLRSPRGVPIDLHWTVVKNTSLRDRFPIPTSQLVEHAVAMQIGDTAVATLDPVDTLLHVALHAALAGVHRLVWAVDIRMAATAGRPAWDEVITRAHRWQAALPIGALLRRSNSVLGESVPQHVTTSLDRGRYERLEPIFTERIAVPSGYWDRAISRLLTRTCVGGLPLVARDITQIGRHRLAAVSQRRGEGADAKRSRAWSTAEVDTFIRRVERAAADPPGGS